VLMRKRHASKEGRRGGGLALRIRVHVWRLAVCRHLSERGESLLRCYHTGTASSGVLGHMTEKYPTLAQQRCASRDHRGRVREWGRRTASCPCCEPARTRIREKKKQGRCPQPTVSAHAPLHCGAGPRAHTYRPKKAAMSSSSEALAAMVSTNHKVRTLYFVSGRGMQEGLGLEHTRG
jgi:hypothetical protein